MAGSADSGGGLYCTLSSGATVTNSIIWSNSCNQIEAYASVAPTVTYSDVEGSWPGGGNINSDPEFIGGLTGGFYLNLNPDSHGIDRDIYWFTTFPYI